ncbi:o-succinylbenzoate synthase [Rubrivirga sp. IMCC43871]|uniref:o-succinylbenzoate synthase n=1 Tax=Rubrivirga sp. IMCC43871 TaxID=3391575 RepID=UPI0039900713
MTIADFRLVPYALPLREPVAWGGQTHAQRLGVLVRLEGADGAVGWGEAAPLPGFSDESLDEVRTELASLAEVLRGRVLSPAEALLGGSVATALDASGLSPSARFGLDLALAELAAQELGRTLPQALHPDPAVVLPLNGLVMGTGGNAVASARRLGEWGYAAVKLKVGRQPVDADLALVVAVREVLPGKVALRLDANRAWGWDDAVRFADGVRGLALDYVEEPLADASRLPELWHDTGLSVAVDESVQEGVPIRGWATAAVLKPTLVGGIGAAIRLATEARLVGVRPVLSAAFESGVGLRGIAALAAATGAEPAGLDTYRWLAADVLGPLPFDRPRVDVAALFSTPPEVALP